MNNLQRSLSESREFLHQQRDTFLQQCWTFLGSELDASLARIPQDGNPDDREAAEAALNSWRNHRDGWRYWNRPTEDRELQNLLRLLDELIRG
jgi:hypothetical protein